MGLHLNPTQKRKFIIALSTFLFGSFVNSYPNRKAETSSTVFCSILLVQNYATEKEIYRFMDLSISIYYIYLFIYIFKVIFLKIQGISFLNARSKEIGKNVYKNTSPAMNFFLIHQNRI